MRLPLKEISQSVPKCKRQNNHIYLCKHKLSTYLSKVFMGARGHLKNCKTTKKKFPLYPLNVFLGN